MGWTSAYLAAELENIQSRSLDIIGLPRDFLPSLEERWKTITAREFNLDELTQNIQRQLTQRYTET